MNGNPIQMIIQMLMSENNPEQLVNQLMQNNPQMKVLTNQIKNSGMTPMQFLQNYAKQNNINIQPYMNILSKKGIK